MIAIAALAQMLGITTFQAIALILGAGVAGGYAISHKDHTVGKAGKADQEQDDFHFFPEPNKQIDINIREIDLWELRRLNK